MNGREDRDGLRERLVSAHRHDREGSVCSCGAEVGVRCDRQTREEHVIDAVLAVVRSEPGQVSAEGAWDEGYRQGIADERTSQAWQTGDGPNRENPYRAVTDTTDAVS